MTQGTDRGGTVRRIFAARSAAGDAMLPGGTPDLRRMAWVAVLAFLAVAVAGILLRPLAPIDETRYVAVAWEMYLSSDYLVPTKNFALYAHKPPLLFWSINLLWSLFGVSEFAARLVGPLYAVAALLLAGRLAARLWPDEPEIGPRATLVLSGFAVFAVLGGLTMFDAMLTVAVLLGLLALLNAVETGAARWWVGLGAAIALGVLAKGPVILLHLGPAILAVPFWAAPRTMTLRQGVRGVGLALLTALGLVGLWVVPAAFLGGAEYRDAILWTQTAGRISNSFAHARPWWYLAGLLPLLLFPWIWVPGLWQRAVQADWRDAGLRLCAVWAGAALVGFSLISGKQPHYLVPELAAMALIFARLSGGKLRLHLWVAVVPVLLVAALVVLVAVGIIAPGDMGDLLKPRSVLLAWVLFAVALCWFSVRLGGLGGGVTLALGLVLSINLLIGMTGIRAAYDTQTIAARIAPSLPDGVAYVGQEYNAEFNFAGRMAIPLATPKDAAALAVWMHDHPQGLILGKVGRADIAWPPQETLVFRNTPYAIWRVVDAPQD